MPVPKRKRSHARIAKAHANKGYSAKTFASCANCTALLLPHAACKECGYYKGVKVLKTKAERSVARGQVRKAKEERARSRQEASTPETKSKE
jgi:large subunit ribosomal protein L32